jgi:hypothetical protein
MYICYVEESRPPLWPSGQSSWLHNGDVFIVVSFEVRTEFICYVEDSRTHMWSSGQSSWLQNRDVFIVFPVRYELNLYMLCRRK